MSAPKTFKINQSESELKKLMKSSVPMTDKSIKTNYLRKAFLSVIIGCAVTSLIMVALNKPYFPPTPQELSSVKP